MERMTEESQFPPQMD